MSSAPTNRAERRALNKQNRKRLPRELSEVPESQWPNVRSNVPRLAVYLNCDYLVQVFQEANGIKRITVNRVTLGAKTWDDGISWDEMQRIKTEIGFSDSWATEIFPPADQVVNVAAMRHMWVLPTAPDYGWKR